MYGLILASIEPSTVVSYVIGLLIVAVGIALVVKHLKEKKGEDELNKFLNEITEILRQQIVAFIMDLDFHVIVINKESIADAEIELVNRIYDKIWELVVDRLDEDYANEPLYIIMKKKLTPEFIRSMAEFIVNSDAVQDLIGDKLVEETKEDEADALEKEYEELNKAIENDTLAEGEEVPEINLEEQFPDKEPIIPPSDVNNEEDGEVVKEVTEEVPLDQLTKAMVDDDEE